MDSTEQSWKARALAAEKKLERRDFTIRTLEASLSVLGDVNDDNRKKLDDVNRHGHPMPNYYPGCSECEADLRKHRAGGA